MIPTVLIRVQHGQMSGVASTQDATRGSWRRLELDNSRLSTIAAKSESVSDRTRADNELKRNGDSASGPGSSGNLLSLFAPHAALRGTFKVSHWHYQWRLQSRPDLTVTVKLIPY